MAREPDVDLIVTGSSAFRWTMSNNQKGRKHFVYHWFARIK